LKLPRSSGILLHPTSLPGGRLGDEAYRFVDWLEAAGQSWWQMLPLGPPDEFRSPYASPSAFAASPGLLANPDAPVTQTEMDDFVARHPYWIGEGARFARAGAIEDQVRFEREWTALRAYARDRGVRLIGDVPIYVSGGSADVEARPELFARGQVAGAPPDALNANGQYWGNPLYDWPVHRATEYHWWIERFRRTFELVDLARVDHFRGYVSYWAIPAQNKTARRGKWRRGPGAELFRAVERGLGGIAGMTERHGVKKPPCTGPQRAGPAGNGGDALGVPHRSAQHAPAGQPPRESGRLHEHARHEHGGRLVRRSQAGRTSRDGARPGRPELEPDRAGPRFARVARRDSGAGRPRPRRRGAHEPSGPSARKLVVAAQAGAADARTGRAVARRDGTAPPPSRVTPSPICNHAVPGP
jgi:hypothetical protein